MLRKEERERGRKKKRKIVQFPNKQNRRNKGRNNSNIIIIYKIKKNNIKNHHHFVYFCLFVCFYHPNSLSIYLFLDSLWRFSVFFFGDYYYTTILLYQLQTTTSKQIKKTKQNHFKNHKSFSKLYYCFLLFIFYNFCFIFKWLIDYSMILVAH